jgi:hypothetical protein
LKVFMTPELRFLDHESFHRSAGWMVVGGIIAGAIAGAAGAGVPGALFAGATGAVLGAGWADRAAGRVRLAARAVLVAAAVAAFALVRPVGGGHLAVAALAAVVGLALNLGVSRARVALAVVVGGGVAYLGGYAAGQVMIARETAPLPDWIEVTLAATAFAGVCIAALLPRHLLWVRDAVAAAQRSLPAGLDPDVRALVDRGTAVWRQVAPQLDADGRTLLGDGVLRLHDLASRWARVGDATEDAGTLRQRRTELDGKVAATDDDVAREQYVEARAAIDDQLRYVDAIRTSRERVVARLHACVTTLEKFKLAVAHLESQKAAAGSPARAMLAEVSADIDACGEALAELDGDASRRAV